MTLVIGKMQKKCYYKFEIDINKNMKICSKRNLFRLLYLFVLIIFAGNVLAAQDSSTNNFTVTVDNGSVVIPDKPIIIRSQDITTNTMDLVVKVGDAHASETLDFVLTVYNTFIGATTTVNYRQDTDANAQTILHVVNLDPGTEYVFHVRYATIGGAYSEESDNHNAVTAIDPPVIDSIDNITDDSADLDVIIDPDFIGGIMDFVVWVKNDDNGDTYTVKMTQPVNSLHVTLGISDLDADTGYTFKVKYARENTPYYSEYSNEKSFTTDVGTIDPPEIIDIVDITTHSMSIIVRFDDRSGEELDVKVHVVNKNTGDTFDVTFNNKTVGDDDTIKFDFDNLDSDTEYEFRVKYSPENTSEYSDYSDPRSARTKKEVVDNDVVICYNDETIVVKESVLQDYLDDGATEGVCTVSGGSTDVEPPSDDEKKDIRDIIAPEETKNTYQAAATIGAFAGAIVSFATSAVPLFFAMPGVLTNSLWLRFLELFGFIGRRKEERNWGVVFEKDTHLPIPVAKIILMDESGNELATTYSDKDGRFGFLVEPGTYMLDVFKKKFSLVTDIEHDDLYGDVYDGKTITVNDDEDVMFTNIAMKAQGIDWKAYADKKIKQYNSHFSTFKKYFFLLLYMTGFAATVVITYFYPSVFNFVVLSIYIILFVYQIFFKKKKYGVIETNDGKPIPFAVVNLYDKEVREKKKFAVTDSIGRYYLLADNGAYHLKAKGQPISGKPFEKSKNVRVRDGIVRKDIIV